ncbi:lyase family protein [Brachybacterium sp. AOP29-B2-41]|uniref:lyase family protein n=1 Tax=Brachybacterium sp. AOP29-B2-41 TaxID=3457704 RepID=UPI004033F658
MTEVQSPVGATTARSLAHSPVVAQHLYDYPELVVSFARIKRAAALANQHLGALDPALAARIIGACDELIAGENHRSFALPIIAAGGGTASNMNANEAIALAANRDSADGETPVHPNDHVNRAQSSNDVYPTALKLTLHPLTIAAAEQLERLAQTYRAKAAEFDGVERLGRTVWQDAVVVPISATHRGQADAMDRLAAGLRHAATTMLRIPLGGTVLGTRVGSSAEFAELAIAELRESTGLDLEQSPNLIDAFAHSDSYAEVAHAAARAALILRKVAQDLRVLSSGPRAGLGELHLPRTQAGSSIMPGKVNPVIPNMVIQYSFGIQAASQIVADAVAFGEPDINVNGPVITSALYPALHQLREIVQILDEHCVREMTWDLERVMANTQGSYEGAMGVAAASGYDAAVRETADHV